MLTGKSQPSELIMASVLFLNHHQNFVNKTIFTAFIDGSLSVSRVGLRLVVPNE